MEIKFNRSKKTTVFALLKDKMRKNAENFCLKKRGDIVKYSPDILVTEIKVNMSGDLQKHRARGKLGFQLLYLTLNFIPMCNYFSHFKLLF